MEFVVFLIIVAVTVPHVIASNETNVEQLTPLSDNATVSVQKVFSI